MLYIMNKTNHSLASQFTGSKNNFLQGKRNALNQFHLFPTFPPFLIPRSLWLLPHQMQNVVSPSRIACVCLLIWNLVFAPRCWKAARWWCIARWVRARVVRMCNRCDEQERRGCAFVLMRARTFVLYATLALPAFVAHALLNPCRQPCSSAGH